MEDEPTETMQARASRIQHEQDEAAYAYFTAQLDALRERGALSRTDTKEG